MSARGTVAYLGLGVRPSSAVPGADPKGTLDDLQVRCLPSRQATLPCLRLAFRSLSIVAPLRAGRGVPKMLIELVTSPE